MICVEKDSWNTFSKEEDILHLKIYERFSMQLYEYVLFKMKESIFQKWTDEIFLLLIK